MKLNIWWIVAVIGLGSLFVLPLWKISLVVPQYPKDIAIYLHIDKIADGSEKALMIMNVLNHNIGMKEIIPEDFKEFDLFPIAVAGFIISGLLLATFPSPKWLSMIWVAVLYLAALAALADFYLWLYDFGNNLDPEAALKIDGQNFQPPVLGIRKVANLEVHSFPSWGALSVAASLVLAVIGQLKTKE
ncbi:MAG: hypothetical protein RIF33_13055 [Cyclobacteriaceae bacterium]